MKRMLLYTLLCALPIIGRAQGSSSIIKHLDIAVSAGTSGFGFEASVPLTKWSEVRFGGVFRPYKTYSSTLPVWKPLGMKDDDVVMQMITSTMGVTPSTSIELRGQRKMQNLKLLWDIHPLKHHRNFYFTMGLFYGNKTLVRGINTNESFNTLSFIREYNMIYSNAQKGEFMDLSGLNASLPQEALDMLNSTVLERIRQSGDMTIPIGTYSHDILDANGQLLHSKGDYVMLRPDKRDVIEVSATVNKLKPYVGVGYTLPVSKDGRSSISLDAGVLIWGGTPSITTNVVEGNDSEGNEITTTIDLLNDVDHLTGDMGKYVRSAKNYPVYPEVSLRFTRRLW